MVGWICVVDGGESTMDGYAKSDLPSEVEGPDYIV